MNLLSDSILRHNLDSCAYANIKLSLKLPERERQCLMFSAQTSLTVIVDTEASSQTIFGFGGAFTDAAGINLQNLSAQTRDALLRAYFDNQEGFSFNVSVLLVNSLINRNSVHRGKGPDCQLRLFHARIFLPGHGKRLQSDNFCAGV